MDYYIKHINNEKYIVTEIYDNNIDAEIYLGINKNIKDYIQVFVNKNNLLEKFLWGNIIKEKIIWGTGCGQDLRKYKLKEKIENKIYKIHKLIGLL